MSFDDDQPTVSVVTSRKEETAVNPVNPVQHSMSMGRRALLASGIERGERDCDRFDDRLQALA